MALSVGDKVGLLSGSETGEVVRISGEDVEVLLDDGLEIIVGRHEVVVRHAAAPPLPVPAMPPVTRVAYPPENVIQAEGEEAAPEMPASLPTPGLSELLPEGPGLLLEAGSRVGLWVGNPRPQPLLAVIYRQSGGATWRLVRQVEVPARRVVLAQDWPSGERGQLARLAVQYAALPTETEDLPRWEMTHFKITAKTWQKPTTALTEPAIRAVYLPFQQTQVDSAPTVTGPMVSERSFSPQLPTAENPVVDLHIEHVAPHLPGLSPDEKRMLQVAHAERALDEALSLGLVELVLIHGIGKGVLRRDVLALLKGHPHVGAYFEDEALGRGATRVVLI